MTELLEIVFREREGIFEEDFSENRNVKQKMLFRSVVLSLLLAGHAASFVTKSSGVAVVRPFGTRVVSKRRVRQIFVFKGGHLSCSIGVECI